MKLNKKTAAIFFMCTLMIAVMTVNVCANNSITNLHTNQSKEILSISPESTDSTNTASLLSQVDIYTNQAVSEQYMEKDENGNLIPTDMSNLIDTAASAITETNENGKSIADPIPTVSEILANVSQKTAEEYEKESGYNPDNLDQLTYVLDFKYASTDYRVIPGESITTKDKTEILDNGMIRTPVKGREILRSSSKEDFVIIQVDPVTPKIYFFEMDKYDEITGDFTADFPCIGPYMITQIMNP